MPKHTSEPSGSRAVPSGPLWWQGAGELFTRPALDGDLTVDVCIVGGGYTGLWTAYHLLEADPSLAVLVLEAQHVGFGASGRNGGWVSALYPVGPQTLAKAHGEGPTRELLAALRSSVDEVGAVALSEGIDAAFVKGGTLVVARSEAQVCRAREQVAQDAYWGLGTQWLGASEARDRLDASGVHGGTYASACARVHPFRLVRGVAEAVERRGGRIVERTRATAVAPGRVQVVGGLTVRARHVVRATEAWSATFPGSRRVVAPVYSLVVATEPLPASVWDRIGLAARETFSEHRHLVVYGQRSVDDRIVFGGRGAPYHFGSRIDPAFDAHTAVFGALRRTLLQLLPVLTETEVAFTHAWGGPLGIPRDWHPSVRYDALTRIGSAGGYVGDGVALSHLAGRTLAELVTGRRTRLAELPWVGHRSRPWEVEPFRWLGVNAGLRLAELADAEEGFTGRPARLGRLLSTVTGH